MISVCQKSLSVYITGNIADYAVLKVYSGNFLSFCTDIVSDYSV